MSSGKEKSGVMPGKGSYVLSVNVIPGNESGVLIGEESTVISGEECGVNPVGALIEMKRGNFFSGDYFPLYSEIFPL